MRGRAADAPTEPDSDERWTALASLEAWLEVPMLVLSFVWLVLVLAELVWGTSQVFEVFGTAIWVVFGLEFAVRLALAPEKSAFLKRNWLTAIALLAPALRLLRILRFLRFARAARGVRLIRIVGTANRTMNALRASLSRRGLGYVVATTTAVVFLGAGGMLAFEPANEVEGGFESYWEALWWTGMLITTMGSQFWPETVEGRILCFLLSLYGLAVFGYITASLASFFIGRDMSPEETALRSGEIEALRKEIELLNSELRRRASSRTAAP